MFIFPSTNVEIVIAAVTYIFMTLFGFALLITSLPVYL